MSVALGRSQQQPVFRRGHVTFHVTVGRSMAGGVHWSEIGDARATDAMVLEYARAHGHVVFTHDLDFGAILANTKAIGPSVIQARAQNVTPESLGDLVVNAIRDHAQRLEAGALPTIDESTMRVRVLPIG